MKVLLISAILLQGVLIAFAGEACNEYVDGILRDLKEDKDVFHDPYEFSEKSFEVGKKVLFVNYTGEASIYDGHIFGMASLHRDGEVVVDRNKKTHLKIWLGAGELNMKSSGKVKLMGHGPKVQIEAKIVYVNMKLDIVPTEKGSNPKVSNFKLEDVKGTEVKVTGLGPLNIILNQYVKLIGRAFKNMIKNGMEARLKTFLNKEIKKYEIPEECLNEATR